MTVRVPSSTRTTLEQIAASQGRRLAGVSREALDEYDRRHAGRLDPLSGVAWMISRQGDDALLGVDDPLV